MNQVFKFLLPITLFFSGNLAALTPSPDSYLVSPAGPYHVGFVDYHWLNEDACPNKFSALVGKNSFSENNKAHCNEVQIRVYYPTHEIGSSAYVPRLSFIEVVNQYDKKASATELESINHLQSFSKPNAKIVKGKYPLIYFTSGYGVSPQLYENQLWLYCHCH